LRSAKFSFFAGELLNLFVMRVVFDCTHEGAGREGKGRDEQQNSTGNQSGVGETSAQTTSRN